jgi:ligand-binding SRPBCC domain-containing protein
LYELERSVVVPAPRDRVFEFFSDPRNLEKITPKSLGLEIISIDDPPIRPGFRIKYTMMPLLGIPVSWTTRIPVFEPPHRFADVQERGPYKHWYHEHTFEDLGADTLMRDRVEYELPFGFLGAIAHRLVVERQLTQIFKYRATRVRRLFDPARLAGASA